MRSIEQEGYGRRRQMGRKRRDDRNAALVKLRREVWDRRGTGLAVTRALYSLDQDVGETPTGLVGGTGR